MNTVESSFQQFPCLNCGANLEFNPQAGKLKCPYCGGASKIPESNEQVEERFYEQYLNTNKSQLVKLSPNALEVNCSNCSANVTFEPPHVAGNCPFCAAAIVTVPQQANPILAPEGIVPFTIGNKVARENIRGWINNRWFAPNGLKELAQPQKLQGVYLPFWTYDATTMSHYSGERGEYYYVTETYTETNEKGENETKTREVRHTRWHGVSGRVERFFDDVLVAATKLVNSDRLTALEPWDLKQSLRPYNPSYLAGFEAQRYQTDLKEGFEIAKSMMAKAIDSDVRRDIGGDEQRVNNISTSYSAITFKHILLPVWISAYRYQNKQYQVMVNAITGEVQGDRPYSVWKIAGAVIASILLAGSIYLIFTHFDKNKTPNTPITPAPTKVVTPSPSRHLQKPSKPFYKSNPRKK